jgi:hypothetical protein
MQCPLGRLGCLLGIGQPVFARPLSGLGNGLKRSSWTATFYTSAMCQNVISIARKRAIVGHRPALDPANFGNAIIGDNFGTFLRGIGHSVLFAVPIGFHDTILGILAADS